MRVIGLLLTCLIFSNLGCAQKRFPVLDDLYRLQDLAEPSLSPDGKWAVYTVNKLYKSTNKSSTNLWIVNLTTKKTQQLTFDMDVHNHLPLWSPDGRWIAFLSDSTDNNELWLYSVKKGRIKQLTHLNSDISDFTWSPDSRNITFSSKRNLNKDNQDPIVINRYDFKSDDDGYLTDARNHLYIVNMKSKTLIQLTTGDNDDFLPTWSPDGKYIAFISERGDDSDRKSNEVILVIKPEKNAVARQVTQIGALAPDEDSDIAWSPDSSKIAYLSTPVHQWSYYAPQQVAVVDLITKKQRIITQIDRWFSKPHWSADGKNVYALVEENRNAYLNQIDCVTGKTKQLTHGLRYDHDYDLAGDKVVVLSSDDQHPSELFILDQTLNEVTHQNKELIDEVHFQPAEDFSFINSDQISIDGLLIKPSQITKEQQRPAILYLHGGPVDQFSHTFDFELQWYAANGYVVIAPNPRGSSGKGLAFSKAIYADWGHLDVNDVLQAADHIASKGIIDPQRLAVGGWSYGGMLTNYVIARDKRFKAALSGAASSNILSNYGIDQYTSEYEHELGHPWQKTETYLKLSYPFMKSNQIITPTLFMCGQLDFNVPCEGSEQLYQALKSLKVPTQLVIYPDEHHTLTTPTHIKDNLKRNVDWLNKYLH